MKRTKSNGALWIVFLFTLVSVCSSFIANRYPLFALVNGEVLFPFVQSWQYDSLAGKHEVDFLISAPIPYSPGISDLDNADLHSPFSEQWMRTHEGNLVSSDFYHRHHLGTDVRGADVLAGILHGSALSLIISGVAAFLALLLGCLAGFRAGWDSQRRISLFHLLLYLFFFFLLYGFWRNNPGNDFRIVITVLLVAVLFGVSEWVASRRINFMTLPVTFDHVVMLLIQLFSLVPRLIFLLAGMILLSPSAVSIIFLMVLTSWFDFARVVRSEVKRIRSQTYLQAASITGAGKLRIFVRHIGPNIWPALSVAFIYSLASNILFESLLSFLGMGLSAETVTLGSLLSNGRNYPEAWWLVVFPGLWLTIFLSALFHLAKEQRRLN